MMAERDRALANRRPEPAMDGLQPEPMLVHRPDLDRSIRVLRGSLRDGIRELFLKPLAPVASPSADAMAAAPGLTSRFSPVTVATSRQFRYV
jgi:hypothetical protein